MSSYGFIKELIEKEHTPTPAYVFDLDKICLLYTSPSPRDA